MSIVSVSKPLHSFASKLENLLIFDQNYVSRKTLKLKLIIFSITKETKNNIKLEKQKTINTGIQAIKG